MKKINEMLMKNFVFALLGICIAAGAAFALENAAKTGEAAGVDSGAAGATPPAELKAEALPKGVSHLRFRAGLLSLRAEGSELTEVLKAVSRETGVGLDYPEDLDGQVTLEIKGSWLQDGLIKILEAAKADSYALSFNDSKDVRLTRITILRSGAPIAQKPANYPKPGMNRRWTDPEAKAYFRAKYGNWLEGGVFEKQHVSDGYPFQGARGLLPEWIKIENMEDALDFAKSFIADNPEAFQLGESELRLKNQNQGATDITIDLQQLYNGIPVDSGLIFFTFDKRQQSMHIANHLGPNISLSTEPKITATEAVEIVKSDLIKTGRAYNENDKFSTPGLSIVTTAGANGAIYELGWNFTSGVYKYFVNANNGNIYTKTMVRR